jgi:hypothetical protein
LRIGAASRKYRLLFIPGADFTEEILDFRIQLQPEENTVHPQKALRYQLLAIKLHYILVRRETDTRSLILWRGLNTIAIWNFDIDPV